MAEENFHTKLKTKMDDYVHLVYKFTRGFPKEEMYGVTSQIRRTGLSVILNYIEGFARMRGKVNKNFLEISYGSLQESKYLLEFSFKEKYIIKENFEQATKMADEIGAMIWGVLRKM